MKRFTGILAAAAIAVAPMSASALEALTDSSMNQVTGQAGVSIAIDDVVIYQESIADVTYTDTDGLTEYSVKIDFSVLDADSDLTNGVQWDSDSDGTPEDYDAAAMATNVALQQAAAAVGSYVESDTKGAITSAGLRIDHDNNLKKLITIDAIVPGLTGGVVTDTDAFYKYTVNGLAETFYTDANGNGTYDDGETDLDVAIGMVNAPNPALMDPSNGNIAGFTTGASPLTIDIGQCTILSAGLDYNGGGNAHSALQGNLEVAGVIIGLPTIEIAQYYSNDAYTVEITGEVGAGATVINDDCEFIKIEKNGSSRMAILGGTLEIAPH